MHGHVLTFYERFHLMPTRLWKGVAIWVPLSIACFVSLALLIASILISSRLNNMLRVTFHQLDKYEQGVNASNRLLINVLDVETGLFKPYVVVC